MSKKKKHNSSKKFMRARKFKTKLTSEHYSRKYKSSIKKKETE